MLVNLVALALDPHDIIYHLKSSSKLRSAVRVKGITQQLATLGAQGFQDTLLGPEEAVALRHDPVRKAPQLPAL